jgi:hypothetical protein
MTHICYVCQSSKGVDECVGCNQFVCKTHAGHIKQYISISGRKGRGCQQCIDEGIVTPDYGLSSISLAINDAVKRLVLYLVLEQFLGCLISSRFLIVILCQI